MPKLEKTYNYNAVCTVKKKASRLALNIKGEGFDTHSTVTMEDERGAHQVCDTVCIYVHAYVHVLHKHLDMLFSFKCLHVE
jgi:hypothetical protein